VQRSMRCSSGSCMTNIATNGPLATRVFEGAGQQSQPGSGVCRPHPAMDDESAGGRFYTADLEAGGGPHELARLVSALHGNQAPVDDNPPCSRSSTRNFQTTDLGNGAQVYWAAPELAAVCGPCWASIPTPADTWRSRPGQDLSAGGPISTALPPIFRSDQGFSVDEGRCWSRRRAGQRAGRRSEGRRGAPDARSKASEPDPKPEAANGFQGRSNDPAAARETKWLAVVLALMLTGSGCRHRRLVPSNSGPQTTFGAGPGCRLL